jgi:hypothetical protein
MTNEDDFIYTGPSSDGLIQINTGQHLTLNVKEDVMWGFSMWVLTQLDLQNKIPLWL